MVFFDLASLTKPLVTAPLALQRLDLDKDRRGQLGFQDRPEPLTVRQLLSHSAGLPPWLPFTGEPLAKQLRRGFPAGAHPLLCSGMPAGSCYSDLGYRLLAELLAQETGQPFPRLGEALTRLSPAPWPACPRVIPDGPDAEAWALAEPGLPVPPRQANLPHDANARAGMQGHAGFGGTGAQVKSWLQGWVAEGYPKRMAIETARAEDGTVWGLGLHRVGAGSFGPWLARISAGVGGVHVVEDERTELPPSPVLPEPGNMSPIGDFWMHLGYTGPALFVRPADGLCLCLLLHRQGPEGRMLDRAQLRARRGQVLETFLAKF